MAKGPSTKAKPLLAAKKRSKINKLTIYRKETVKLEAVADNNIILLSVVSMKDGKETGG